MPIRSSLRTNLYKDSVALMRLAELVTSRTGVKRATLLMGTSGNKDMLSQAGMLDAGVQDAKPSDIMIVVEDESEAAIAVAIDETQALINDERLKIDEGRGEDGGKLAPRSIGMALGTATAADIVQISIPGPYAGAEAVKALRQGLNVFCFSDNVPLAQERAIKDLAARKDLLMMGPDCGTAIIRGVPLGFANVVRQGSIGLVGASGTGLQAVSCLIHRLGGGVSHVIGTGSRDVHEAIGGISMRQGLKLLAADPATQVIAIVSKPPAAEVRRHVLALAEAAGKPVIACFLEDSDIGGRTGSSVRHAATLEDVAVGAVALAKGVTTPKNQTSDGTSPAPHLSPTQRYLRGLYSGGTFCYEAQLVWRRAGIVVSSNAPLNSQHSLKDSARCIGHCAIDLGSDEFTVGRPHPMIDYATRIDRLLREATDPTVAAIVLDVVLGYGSHADPAGALAPAIQQAKEKAAQAGRDLVVICFVCGTEEDPQQLSLQQEKLRRVGVVLTESSGSAARVAAAILRHVAAS
jgi:succinyl-CoA synthetase alpha subunit